MKKPLNISRIFRLSLFAIVLTAIATYLGITWIYVGSLIDSGCWLHPEIEGAGPHEVIELETKGGLTLEAWYYPSQNGAAVIATGGIDGAWGDTLPLAKPLIDAGYGVLQIGSRGCAGEPVTLGGKEIDEVVAAVSFLESRPEVDPLRIGIIGFSMGGVTAIRAAARQNEIAAVIAEGGFYNLGDDFVEPDQKLSPFRRAYLYSIAYLFWIRTGVNPWDISPVDDIGKISPRPVFLIYGEHEMETGHAQLQYDSANEPKELWIVPGGDHGSNYGVSPEEYVNKILIFFEENLRD